MSQKPKRTLRRLPSAVIKAMARYYSNRDQHTTAKPWDKDADVEHLGAMCDRFGISCLGVASTWFFQRGRVRFVLNGPSELETGGERKILKAPGRRRG